MTDYRPPTDDEADRMIKHAFIDGLDATYTDEDGTTDWDRLVSSYETGDIDLGTDNESPLIRKIRAAYRRGLKEE